MSFELAASIRTICPRCAVIDDALKWADRGFPVFPIVPRGKKPLGSLVPHGLKDATRENAIICGWWRHEPKANIGIVTGGGHFVLDLDDAEAVSWFGRHGAPKTLTVRTARGFHVFFACDAKVPSSTARIAPGVDVRGDGGYVVAAPSIHPSGAVYTIARNLPIADAPNPAAIRYQRNGGVPAKRRHVRHMDRGKV
jgi:Bifunctional DNA primase/polymerase, N-terminal